MTSQSTPFAFNNNGLSAVPRLRFVLTAYAAQQFKLYAPKNTNEQKALSVFNDFCEHLVKTKEACLLNKDIKSGDFPVKKIGAPSDLFLNLATVVPSDYRQGFRPEHSLNISENPQSWGWSKAENVLSHIPVLRQIANSLNCNVKFEAIKKIAELYKDLESNKGITIRLPDVLNNLGRSVGYAAYVDGKGYIDMQGFPNTLDKARLYPNAESAVKKFGFGTSLAVEIEISVKNIVGSSNDINLLAAVSVLQKERLEKAIEQAEVELLRNRLKELGFDTTPTSRPKKKM